MSIIQNVTLRSINYTFSNMDRRRVIRLLHNAYEFQTRPDHQPTISIINQARVVLITHIRKTKNKTLSTKVWRHHQTKTRNNKIMEALRKKENTPDRGTINQNDGPVYQSVQVNRSI